MAKLENKSKDNPKLEQRLLADGQTSLYLDGMENFDLKQWGENLHERIRKCVGMPVSIGLAPTKTLAKMASHFAKKYSGYRHCCMIDTNEKRVKALKLFPIEDVWGIGPNSPQQLDLFDYNAEQFEKMKRLDAVMDRINRVNGTETIVLGSQQYTKKNVEGKADVFANAIKHDFKSKNPTTRWSDIIELK